MAFWDKNIQHFLTKEDCALIQEKIKQAEDATTGEIRVMIESRCPLTDTLAHAANLFTHFKMNETVDRDATLIYIAYKDKEFAIYGDKNCYEQFPKKYWHSAARRLSYKFYQNEKVAGIVEAIESLGKLLAEYFPNKGVKKNQLPDEIIFGK
jgi:uncharacterized membrane protein